MSCCPTCNQKIPAGSPLVLDIPHQFATANGMTVKLTRHQMILLRELYVNATHIVAKQHLWSCLWGVGEDMPVEPDKTLKVQVSRLRAILWPLGLGIITEYGQGYRLVGRGQPVAKSQVA